MPRSFGQQDYAFSKFYARVVAEDAAIELAHRHVVAVVELNAAASQTITIPAALAETDYPRGAQSIIVAAGAGGGSLAPGVGVTINGGSSPVAISASYGDFILLTRDTDTNWLALKAVSSGGSSDAFTVKATTNDTTPSFLGSKLLAGANVTLTLQNPGANENYVIDVTIPGGDGVITINPQTASYVAALADNNQIVTMTVAGANTFTIPLNATVAFPVGARVTVAQLGAGQTTITPAGGVTINEETGDLLMQQYQCMTLLKTGTDAWVITTGLFSTNDVHNYTKSQSVAQVTLTDAATIATDCSLSNNFTVTLGGNRTLGAPTNPTAGMVCNWEIKQDATGSRTLAFNAAFLFPGGTDPVASTAANAIDFMSGYYDGASWLCNYSKAYA